MFYVDVFLLDINVFIESDFFFLLEHTTSSSSSSSSSKRPRLDQIPAANLDADDPLTDVHTLSYRCLGMQVDFDGSFEECVCVCFRMKMTPIPAQTVTMILPLC